MDDISRIVAGLAGISWGLIKKFKHMEDAIQKRGKSDQNLLEFMFEQRLLKIEKYFKRFTCGSYDDTCK